MVASWRFFNSSSTGAARIDCSVVPLTRAAPVSWISKASSFSAPASRTKRVIGADPGGGGGVVPPPPPQPETISKATERKRVEMARSHRRIVSFLLSKSSDSEKQKYSQIEAQKACPM